MEPRAVAEAVETGKEDVIMEALRSYNQEVSGRLRPGGGHGGRGAGSCAGGRDGVGEAGVVSASGGDAAGWGGRSGMQCWGESVWGAPVGWQVCRDGASVDPATPSEQWLLPELEANRPPPSAGADTAPLWT